MSLLLLLLVGLEDLERAHQRLVDAHEGARVVELPAVVGGREDGHQLALREELVALLDHLVGSADEVHVVGFQEARNDVRPEDEAHSSLVFGPPVEVFLGVRPQQIAQ